MPLHWFLLPMDHHGAVGHGRSMTTAQSPKMDSTSILRTCVLIKRAPLISVGTHAPHVSDPNAGRFNSVRLTIALPRALLSLRGPEQRKGETEGSSLKQPEF